VVLPVGLKANWSLGKGLGRAGRRNLLTIKCSKSRDKIGVTEIGCISLNSVGGLTLGIGVLTAHFLAAGQIPQLSMILKICVTTGAKTPTHLRNNQNGDFLT
jgi:hypothetical protein